MMRRKVTIVGAGNVGGTAAQRLAEKDIADVVLVDLAANIAKAKSLDILEAGPIYGYNTRIIGTGDYEETAGSDVCVITAGIPRRPGMTRDQLLEVNTKVVASVARALAERSPKAILLVVTNPLDAMTYLTHKVSGFPKERVMGMAGVLDASRFSAFVAVELGVSVENVQAMVIGGHVDMIPLSRYTKVAGIAVEELIKKERLDAIIRHTVEAGGEIVELLKTGSAFVAPSAAIVEMVEAVLKDKKKILPATVLCQGEYGLRDVFIGVPAKLGVKGVEGIVELRLSGEEGVLLKKSAQVVKAQCEAVDRLILQEAR